MCDASASSSDAEDAVGTLDTTATCGSSKPKRWSRSENEEYFVNIMIRTCCQVHESGKTINTSMIHLEVMEGWHKRYFNKCIREHHPKPHCLTHPDVLWKNTAFADQDEYDTWLSSPAKLGKPTVAHPHGGMKQSYHDFADKIWEKFKIVKREIAASTQVCMCFIIHMFYSYIDTLFCRFIGTNLFLGIKFQAEKQWASSCKNFANLCSINGWSRPHLPNRN